MPEIWDFLYSPAASAAFNMALDEALLRTAMQRGRPLLRVYSWEKPSVSFGYFQKFPAHLADGYEAVRRSTGGGVVYHVEDTTYTVVVPPANALYAMKTTDAYGALHKAVAAALSSIVCSRESHSRLGAPLPRKSFAATTAAAEPALHQAQLRSPQGQYECFQKPVHGDVVADGRKLAGGAQRRTKSGMLHQGSIAANLSAEQLKRGFQDALDVGFAVYELTDAERALAEKLAREKYSAASWNHRIGTGSRE
jgi:lipoate-protein ligase A